MKILFFARESVLDGASSASESPEAQARAREVAQFADALCHGGHDVCVAVASRGERAGAPEELVELRGGQVRLARLSRSDGFPEHWHKSSSPEVAAQVRELLARFAPEVAHVHSWSGLTRELVTLCARAGVPAVVELRDAWTSCLVGTRVRPDTREACDVSAATNPCLACARHAPPATPWVPLEAQYMLFAERERDIARELALASSVLVDGELALERARRWLGASASQARFELAPRVPTGRARSDGERDWVDEWLAIYARARTSGAPRERAGVEDWYSERMRSFALEQWDRARLQHDGSGSSSNGARPQVR